MKKLLFAAAFAAPLCFTACKSSELVASAAENGLRKDLKPVCEVINFKEVATEEKTADGGKAALVRFEGEVKWLTLEEAVSSRGAARDAQEYLLKLEYASSKLGGVSAGSSVRVKGAILLAKTDLGWLYKGLSLE
ncbi:MAG: hypothetical protein A2X31_02920 [Elusimicrobia bacterium GWB2_63_22]|nr:MAG: hypothetical protein A2X31_02920 [Elusimicrobia bacterium GWB2_63_22]